MSIIIPYKEKELYKNGGAFIAPNGNILFTNGLHESFAFNYCNGENYRLLFDIKVGCHYYYEHFEEFKKLFGFDGSIEEIDIFSSSKLTIEQLKLYKLWIEKYAFSFNHLSSDFMVSMLAFDKVETIVRETITTASPKPHIRFFNYYLMDWDINNIPPIKYNYDTGLFEYADIWHIGNTDDADAEDEIEEIKAKVLKKDRPLFFK